MTGGSLVVEDLTVSVGTGTAERLLVDSVSFSLARGERLGILGESGSGKSLTSLAIAGLVPSGLTVRGSVLVDGVQTVGASDRALGRVRGARVAIVFQEPLSALDPLMRVGRQIAEPLRRHRGLRGSALREAVPALMAEVALPDPATLARSFPHQISGGQRQRVAIAMALACNPDFLIADEPTTALDVSVQRDIIALLQDTIRRRDMGLVFVSHDVAVVSELVDRVLVMRAGRVVESGPVAEVLSAPRAAYTHDLIMGVRALETALATGTLPPADAGGDPR